MFSFSVKGYKASFLVGLKTPKKCFYGGNNNILCNKCAETQPNSFIYVFTAIKLTIFYVKTIHFITDKLGCGMHQVYLYLFPSVACVHDTFKYAFFAMVISC